MDRVTQLAFQIADGAARCDIEMLCGAAGGEPKTVEEMRECWYDLNQLADTMDALMVRTAVEYLDYRGLLTRHPTQPHWVRTRRDVESR